MAEPLYHHNPDRLHDFFRRIYDGIQGSREARNAEPLPRFEIWMGNEGMGHINAWRDYTPAVDPRLN